jgi:Tat protein translocase TatB subunit
MPTFFLFLESIGTSEIILIALVALIIFGPRKLPGMARQVGKYTADFKRASREFRETFEREVSLAEAEEQQRQQQQSAANRKQNSEDIFDAVENTIGRKSPFRGASAEESQKVITEIAAPFALPEVRQLTQTEFAAQQTTNIPNAPDQTSSATGGKRDWL